MHYTHREYQARINALYGEPVLVVDGMYGPQTKKWTEESMKRFNVSRKEDLFHESGIRGIVWHWTASTYSVTREVLSHYNDVHDYKGNSYDGGARAEHQAAYSIPRKIGVSHTKNMNTGWIGQAVAAMGEAEGWPKLVVGNYPMTWEGIDAMLERSAYYCKLFDIPVSRWSTLSHAEVQPTLGVMQDGKWDIRVLPEYKAVKDAVEVGDILRDRLKRKFMK